MADQVLVSFALNGEEVEIGAGVSLLIALREGLGITSVKDGCAPQGQCGCCTVLVDGEPRVACVTPVERVAGRAVTTIEGLEPGERDGLAEAFCATGGSQCGFCTPGILVRAASMVRRGKTSRVDMDRALAAHLCRCTGWQTIYETLDRAAAHGVAQSSNAGRAGRDFDAATERARLEGGVTQRVMTDVPLGAGGFADDLAPRDALVAVPLQPGISADGAVEAAGALWVVGESPMEARAGAGKVQGRRTTVEQRPPLELPPLPDGGVRLATSWVDPAYLEPDASWCVPGGDPATPLANGGAFGGKESSVVARVARELADRFARPVRVLYSREDTVRLGPKRAPISASAVVMPSEGSTNSADPSILISGRVARDGLAVFGATYKWPYRLEVKVEAEPVDLVGPTVASGVRASGWAEQVVLVEGAIAAAGIDRRALVTDERSASVLLDTCVRACTGALAGARVTLDPSSGALADVQVCVAAGDPLDEVVLRSYAIGAVHMALGWVLSEGLTVDPATGELLDLTIRSFGIIRAKDTPPIRIRILDDPGPPLGRSSDAVLAAVAAATWNALAQHLVVRPESFPASGTPAARMLRR